MSHLAPRRLGRYSHLTPVSHQLCLLLSLPTQAGGEKDRRWAADVREDENQKWTVYGKSGVWELQLSGKKMQCGPLVELWDRLFQTPIVLRLRHRCK